MLISGCGSSPFTFLPSAERGADAAAVLNGEKALVLFRAETFQQKLVETHWRNWRTGEEKKLSSRLSAPAGEKFYEYELVQLEPGEYVLTCAVYGGSDSASSPSPRPQADAYGTLGQVVVDVETSDNSTAWRHTLFCPGTDAAGKPLLASFTVAGGEVVYLGDMRIDFSHGISSLGYFRSEEAVLDLSNQRTRAKNTLLELFPDLATKMQYRPFSYGKLARHR